MNNVSKACDPRPFWSPLVAGIALGLVLLLTFVLTGHGLGATGFFTRLAAWSGGQVAFDATYNNVYLGPLLDDGKPLSSWITWQVIGVALGALAASYSGITCRYSPSCATIISRRSSTPPAFLLPTNFYKWNLAMKPHTAC